jgi:hypothetical protein
MKRITLAIALLMVVSVFAEAQMRSYVTAARHFRTGTTYSSWAHDSTGGITDTMQAVNVDQYLQTYYNVYALDSLSTLVYYQPSYDGVTYLAPVLIDSMSTATANTKSFLVPSGASGLRAIRFVRVIQAFRLGVTTPTVYEKIVQKR